MTIEHVVILTLAVVLIGFLLGNVLAQRGQKNPHMCSCHTPVRFALLKYAGISIVFAMMVLGSACARPQCRDPRTGRFISCRRALVRECGATVGNHFSAQEFNWVQDCNRKDREGCAEKCRPARSACEGERAACRGEDGFARDGRTQAQATKHLEDLDAMMAKDCPK